MKKILIPGVAIILLLAGIASSAELSEDPIAKLAWDAANIDKLRAFDKAAIIRFAGLNRTDQVYDFGWFDLKGDGRYELAVTYSSGPHNVWLDIYWQAAPGKMKNEDLFSGADTQLDKTIRDLNGDGKFELILYTDDDFFWPQVKRLQNGSWVEASRDFPSFYNTEVLPQLDKDIDEARENAAKHQGEPGPAPGDPFFREAERAWRQPQRHLADLLMEKAKILRVLGRDPNAGLTEAREWVNSDDPFLVKYALGVFDDIGGHEQEVKAAKNALIRLDPSEAETLRIEEGK